MAYFYTPNHTQITYDQFSYYPFQSPDDFLVYDHAAATSYGTSAYEYAPSESLICYSSNFNANPEFVSYYYNNGCDFPAYDHHDEPDSIRYMVSYSNVVPSDVLEFEEYDPTPYGGGYDIVSTYGKPLPPSDETCYRPSLSVPDPKTRSMINISEKQVADHEKEKEEEKTQDSEKPEELSMINISSEKEQIDHEEEEEEEEETRDSEGLEEEERTDLDDEYRMPKRQIPPGYGLESLDICGGLFGYFPCLYKKYEQGGYSERNEECWNKTADYLFGNPYPYGGKMEEKGSYGDPIYCYEKHFQQQDQFFQVEDGGVGYSWMHDPRYYYD